MDREHPVSPWAEWKIVEKIGEGSFGKVYKAQRSERGKFFYSAIKVINIPGSQSELNSVRSEAGDDQSVREYFWNLVEECIQEISTMEYFRGNSHIVSVEDFKVMEYLDDIGWEISIRMEYLTSFMDYCAENQLTEKDVIKLGLDLSKALGYCRKLNIIHRDIKPENIFVSRFGDFKLGDFGIARELERTMSSFSKKGTYSYMAPEMYKGEKYDSRVDIYSLGIVLYKLMNRNRLPFLNLEKQFITYRDKENALARRMSGEPLKKPADAGEMLSEIILKACAYRPEDRYQTPEEFYNDLDDLQHGRYKAVTKKGAGSPAVAEALQQSRKQQKPEQQNAAQKPSQQKKNVVQQKPEQSHKSGDSIEARAAQSQARLAQKRRQKRRRQILGWLIPVLLTACAAVIIFSIYMKMSGRNDSDMQQDTTGLVDILENEKYETNDSSKDFLSQIETIKERATSIVDTLEANGYDWTGVEGDKISYYNHDTREYMKVLVYPSSSEDKVYEEYYYWKEKLFFAYIWYDTKAELYYYDDDGNLIRWIDENEICHDNEKDNPEYMERGAKYLKRAETEMNLLKGSEELK
ncbi:MAG: serine/threonine-protein kinase [Eubacteriales bacterium]|nr:serine/threonine-protein kinase [Eubacteriales bacterium]